MSSLPSHHGFFFLDAFVSTSFLVALYHSIRSLLLPDIIPHPSPMAVRFSSIHDLSPYGPSYLHRSARSIRSADQLAYPRRRYL